MKQIISIILTVAVLAGIYIPAGAAAGSMEGWSAANSGTLDAKAQLDTTVSHSGKASLKVTRSTPRKSNVYMSVAQGVAVEKGKTYQYGFWAKAKNINGVSTLIDWGPRAALNPVTGTYDWTYFSFKYTHTKVSGNVSFKVLFDAPIGEFWLDDMEFCEYSEGKKGKNLLKNPGFEGDVQSTPNSSDSTIESEFTTVDFNANVATAKVIPVYKSDRITIDGELSDWEGTTRLDLPKGKNQVQAYSTQTTDAKVSMRFAYDETYFYFLTIVEDDVFFDKQGSEYWQGDSIQLCLSENGSSYGSEIGFSYSEEGGGKYALDFGEKQMDGLLLKAVRNGNTTCFESAIPWELYYKEFKDQILFNAIYNDNDGSGRKYAIQIAGGIAEGKTNAEFPTFRMIPEACDFFAWSEGPNACTVFETNEYNVCILNNSEQNKNFLVKVGEEEKTLTIPAKSGKKIPFGVIFDDVGKLYKEFSVNDGESTQAFSHFVSVIATPDFYDAALAELRQKAEEIKSLIKQCNDRGITTDYEEPVAFLLERFTQYIKEDAERQYFDIMDYTFEELERMYTEAKANLEAYLTEEKTSLATPKFVTGDIRIDGLTHWADTVMSGTNQQETRPVFFIGYGHFAEATADIPNFSTLGANSIQNEFGTNKIITTRNSVPGFSIKINKFKAEYTIVKDKNEAQSGSNYVKIVSTTPIQNDCYSALTQTLAVEPNTTYEFGGKIRATAAKKFWMALTEWPNNDNRNQLGGTYAWKDVAFEYTTGDKVTSTMFQIFIEDTAEEILIDDLWVRKKGTKTNLLKNNSFESKYEDFGENKRASVLNVQPIINTLETAEKNNVSMSLLLSPHYWPAAVMTEEEVKDLTGALQWMNMKSDEAKEVMEKYLEYLLPAVKKYKSLTNICITNEPRLTTSMNDYYHEDFVAYLKKVYDHDLAEYNRINGTAFTDFNEVQMPADTVPSVLFYDWKQFNDQLVYEWSSWVADLVHKHLPDIPVHAKIMQTIYVDDASLRVHMRYGSEIEKYASFSDVHGCDAFNYYSPVKQDQKLGENTNPTTTVALEKTMWYDLLTSVKYMPVYNTEDHVIVDSSKKYSHDVAVHVGADMWQGALHGRGNTVVWVWSRKHGDTALANSILTRPDAILEVSKATLDVNRLSYEAAALADKVPRVGLVWSDTSRCYQYSYANNLYKAYESSVYNGQKTGFVSENMIENAYQYDVVICPNVVNTKKETAEALLNYAKSGGTLVLMGNACLTADEHNQPLDKELVAEIYEHATLIETVNDSFKMTAPDNLKKQFADIFDAKGLRRIRVVDLESGNDVNQVEFMYTDYNDKLLVNLVLYDWTKNRNVKILVDGEVVSSSKELRSMTDYGESFELKTCQPVLLEIDTGKKMNGEGIQLQVGNPVMTVDEIRQVIDSSSYDTVPVVVNARTLLPVRAVVEAIGGVVSWNGESNEATLSYGDTVLRMTIGENTAYVNGAQKELDVTPQIMNGRTMLPIRFIAENFGLSVDWQESGKIVTINR